MPVAAAVPHVPGYDDRIDAEDAGKASERLRTFGIVAYVVAVVLLGLAGFIELYVDKATFGANAWSDYTALFAWGFGAEATRSAVTDLVRGWDVPFGGQQEGDAGVDGG